MAEFPIWKTVTLGLYKNAYAYRRAFRNKGIKNNDRREDGVLNKTPMGGEKTEVDLVLLSVEEMGFPKGASLKDIYAQAFILGLQVCPAEVGLALRLSYNDQPEDSWVWVAMNPIQGKMFRLIYGVCRCKGGPLELRPHCGYPGGPPSPEHYPNERFVFARSR